MISTELTAKCGTPPRQGGLACSCWLAFRAEAGDAEDAIAAKEVEMPPLQLGLEVTFLGLQLQSVVLARTEDRRTWVSPAYNSDIVRI